MDLVRIEAFAYTARVQHLTVEAMQARGTRDSVLQKQSDQREMSAEAKAALEEKDRAPDMPKSLTRERLNQLTQMYDLILVLPNDDYDGIGRLVRAAVLRKHPQIGVLVGEDFERQAIQLAIHSVQLLGDVFGDAHALADLEATPRG